MTITAELVADLMRVYGDNWRRELNAIVNHQIDYCLRKLK